jgi:hypothetical protein
MFMGYYRNASSNRRCTALPSTCSQTHYEAEMIWYSHATFNSRLSGLVKGRRQLGEEAFRCLTSIAISVELASGIHWGVFLCGNREPERCELSMPAVKRIFVCGKLRDPVAVVAALRAFFEKEDLEVSHG